MKILSLDLSLSNTGWAKGSYPDQKLLDFGEISPSKTGLKNLKYPLETVIRIERLVDSILKLIDSDIEYIFCEEVNRGIGRLSQKILCMVHGVLFSKMTKEQLAKVIMVNSDGSDGWRSKAGLKLQLTEVQRLQNKQIKKLNRKLKKGSKVGVIDVKQLACSYVNERYGLKLDVKTRKKDSDLADAIGLMTHAVDNILPKMDKK